MSAEGDAPFFGEDSAARDRHWTVLMERAQSGDREAYQQLFEELTPVLRSFFAKRLNRGDEVEDMVQEVFLAIHKARHTFDPRRSFLGWMFSIARYKFIDYIRRHARVKRHEVFDEDIAEQAGWYDFGSGRDDREELMRAMQSLPDTQKRIVELLKLKGLSVREVASEVQLSESAVKVNAHRAYKKLRAGIQRLRHEY